MVSILSRLRRRLTVKAGLDLIGPWSGASLVLLCVVSAGVALVSGPDAARGQLKNADYAYVGLAANRITLIRMKGRLASREEIAEAFQLGCSALQRPTKDKDFLKVVGSVRDPDRQTLKIYGDFDSFLGFTAFERGRRF